MSESPTSPTVTVVIPAYNAARWITETLDSVLAQTYRDFEIIVVDDGSTDETPEVVAAYGHRVRYLRKENGGSASARNVGIRAARGSYIAFVDADDLWMPEKLQLQMQSFSNYPDLAWVYSDAVVFEDQIERQANQTYNEVRQSTKLHAGDVLRPLFLHDFISSPTPVIKREVFDAVGYFDESLLRSEDWDMWLRVAAQYQVKFVAQPLAKHRLHANSKAATMDLQFTFRSRLTIIENAVTRYPERLSDLRARAIANQCIGIGQFMVQRRDRVRAREMFARAIRLCPYDVRALGYWLATLLPLPFLNRLITVRRFLMGMGAQVESRRLGEKTR